MRSADMASPSGEIANRLAAMSPGPTAMRMIRLPPKG